ncbi:MAG: stage II sporulation protein P [Firmicutes bacterium]|nr:stage II sporulation protein P [Bacillota bacterium]MCL5038872.1 stage II sporulation protein P [Bacillota bacterium]
MKRFSRVILIVCLSLGLLAAGLATYRAGSPLTYLLALLKGERERSFGFYTILGEDGEILLQTGLAVRRGDRYLSQDNRLYEVYQVKGDTAQGRLIDLYRANEEAPVVTSTASNLAQAPAPADLASKLIFIYHTHSDESYTPTDGRPDIPGNGGIYQVGTIFADSLKDQGFQVIHDLGRHDPHDALAYTRSRRTVFNALKNYHPYALFDVHRDSAPARFYATSIENVPTAQIMIVVGRQNPTMSTNLLFARRLKETADSLYPNLVRGIFMAHGNYNQDLDPMGILVEVGTEGQARAEAERGIALFSRVVAAALGTP